MSKVLRLHWRSGEPKGTTDIYRLDDFSEEGGPTELTHVVLGVRGGKYHARFELSVDGPEARLNYSAFPEFNEWQGMDLGDIVIRFTDKKRREVAKVYWRGKGLRRAEEVDVDIDYAEISEEDSELSGGLGKLTERPTRIASAAFRRAVERAYRFRCALTDCPVPAVLDAAHIDTYAATSSNALSNGLLLRRDLHSLFDAQLLAFHPRTLKAHFASDALHWPEYAELHKRRSLSPPQGPPNALPDGRALRRRWSEFIRMQSSGTGAV